MHWHLTKQKSEAPLAHRPGQLRKQMLPLIGSGRDIYTATINSWREWSSFRQIRQGILRYRDCNVKHETSWSIHQMKEIFVKMNFCNFYERWRWPLHHFTYILYTLYSTEYNLKNAHSRLHCIYFIDLHVIEKCYLIYLWWLDYTNK